MALKIGKYGPVDVVAIIAVVAAGYGALLLDDGFDIRCVADRIA
jgi:hypothetical protein